MQFWYEFASTYSYLAVMRVGERAAGARVPVDWRAFLLGPIFGAQGWNDSPFNLYPAKGRYMWRDLERLCEHEGLPWRKPSSFPRNGLRAARLSLLAEAEGWADDFACAVFRANFAEDREIGERSVLAEILGDLGRDANALLERAESPENKQALRARGDEAAALEIFGAPTFVVRGELFWGYDRLELALEAARP